MSAADASAALAAYLKTTAVGDLTSGRVFRPTLDSDLDSQMPVSCVVIRRAGGYQMFGGGTVPMGDPRMDLVCYGETDLAAERLASEVVSALRALRQSVHQQPDGSPVRLYWARIDAGPMPLVDPDTNWPCVFLSAQVAHTEPVLT